MPIVETHGGDLKILALVVDNWNRYAKLRCHLFTNDYTPTPDTVAADMVEPDNSAYAPAPVKYWTPPLIDQGAAFSGADPCIFTFDPAAGGVQIVGYWMEDTTEPGSVWFAERFEDAVPIDPAGDSFVFFPTFRLKTLPPT